MQERLLVESTGRDPECVLRGVAGIVIVGVLLGLAFNQLGRMGSPPRGMAWIAERKTELPSLEGLGGAQERGGAPAANLDDPLGGVVAAGEDGSLPEVPDLGQPLRVDVSTVKRFYDAGAAMIVDARDAEDYAQGHIPGALNLPSEQALSDPARLEALDPGGRPIIVYCGGGACEASMHIAEALIYQAGKRRVLVYEGGWPEWVAQGYPGKTGAER